MTEPAGYGQEPAHDPEPTGHPTVDGALAGLAEAAALPPAEQVSAYEAAHRALQQTLATIDES